MTPNTQPIRICLGLITRKRPEQLQRALESLVAQQRPENSEILIVVVENDTIERSKTLIQEFSSEIPISYALEPRHGIPFARNKVLEMSIRANCDFTTFIDDDEIAAPDWLAQIYGYLTSRNLDLAGGPVRLQPAPKLPFISEKIWHGLERRRQEIRQNRKIAAKGEGAIDLATNNWMVRNAFIDSHNLRFDETIGAGGGSDITFCHAAKKRGAKTGWASSAVVYEMIPPERLTVDYQFTRNRDQSLTSFNRRYSRKRTAHILKNALFFVSRSLIAGIYLILSIPTAGRFTYEVARHWGLGVGRLYGIFGLKTQHYIDT